MKSGGAMELGDDCGWMDGYENDPPLYCMLWCGWGILIIYC